MNNRFNYILVTVITVLMSAQAHSKNSIGYWYDSSNDIVHTDFGECWRTIHWAADNAVAECEGGVVKKVAASDSDKDGVVDSKDQCADTARGVSVDANGCESDSDKDGVVDSKDQCKDTIKGADVDAKGCAIDSDKDGIADINDDCANTVAGTVVNNRGCELEADISLDNVQFKTGTSELSADSRNILDNVAVVLLKNKHLNFEVAGHTDNTGNYQNNVNLSASRANSVKRYLVDKGVAADRLSARGYGPDQPVASNDTSDGRKMNRRVELVLK